MSVQEQQAPAEEQTISGVVAGIIVKNADTWQVSVRDDPGSQYTKNLWTKDGELVGLMTLKIGQEITFFCRVSHWNRQDGQAVRSLWINGWTDQTQDGMQPIGPTVTQQMPQQPVQQQGPSQPPPPQSQPQPRQPDQWPATAAFQPQPVTQDVKEIRIMREAADKCAAQVLSAIILAGGLKAEDLTPARLHGFMDGFSTKRLKFYETGNSVVDDSDGIPF